MSRKKVPVPVGPKPFIFKKFSRKGPGGGQKYRWGGNLSFVVHRYKCLVLKNI
jgi:hypothetical protein